MAYIGGFDHEKLDVYRLSIEFQRWVGPLIDSGPGKGSAPERREAPGRRKHVDQQQHRGGQRQEVGHG